MKNPGKSLREAYMAALQSVQYNGSNVTVYEFMSIETTPDNYIYINSMAWTQVGNNQLFIHDGSIAIDIVTKQYKKLDYDVVDEISYQVINTILTFPYSTITDTDFQFMNPQVESAQYLLEQDGAYHIVRKIVRFAQSLIQK
jgi:hypothetical protein